MRALAFSKHTCSVCGGVIGNQSTGRQRRFCSDHCRKDAFRSKYSVGRTRIADATSGAFRRKQNQQVRPPKNGLTAKASLSWMEVDAVTWKLTDGKMWRTPACHGHWAGYESERGVAWISNIGWPFGISLWRVYSDGKSVSPIGDFRLAKAAAEALARGQPLPDGEAAQ